MRTFHLERVSDPELTDIVAVHRADPVPDLFAPAADEVVARFRFPRAVAPLLSDYLERATIEGDGDIAVASLQLADEQSLKRLAARRGGEVELLEPSGARKAAAAWAAAGLAQYGSDSSPTG